MPNKGKSSGGRAGKRKDRNARFATREPILGYYLIVTDTEETEKNYFEGLKNSIPSEIRDRIVIKVEKAKTTYNLVERTIELEIWMFAYFGEMPNIPDSVTCCSRFAERFERVTGQPYQKNDVDVYKKLLQYGSFDTAFQLAERHLMQVMEDRKKPSEAYPVCTVHRLVKEITDKVQSQQ